MKLDEFPPATTCTDEAERPIAAEVSELELRRREQAARLDCFTEQETAELTGHTVGTLKTYRAQRVGLPWVRVGPEVLYPIDAMRKHLKYLLVLPRTDGDTL